MGLVLTAELRHCTFKRAEARRLQDPCAGNYGTDQSSLTKPIDDYPAKVPEALSVRVGNLYRHYSQ